MSTAPEHTGAYERLALVLDGGSMRELNEAVVGGDPLAFPGYEEKLLAQRVKTEMLEANSSIILVESSSTDNTFTLLNTWCGEDKHLQYNLFEK